MVGEGVERHASHGSLCVPAGVLLLLLYCMLLVHSRVLAAPAALISCLQQILTDASSRTQFQLVHWLLLDLEMACSSSMLGGVSKG